MKTGGRGRVFLSQQEESTSKAESLNLIIWTNHMYVMEAIGKVEQARNCKILMRSSSSLAVCILNT